MSDKDINVEFPSEKDMDDKDTQTNVNRSETADGSEKTENQSNSEVNDDNVDDLKNEITQKNQEIDKLKSNLSDMEDKYLRSQAEIKNIQNRNEKEREQLSKYSGQELAKSILPAVDNIDRALEVEVTDEKGQQLKRGIELVQKSLQNALKENDITEIEAENQPFDPNKHQAVQTVPADDEHPKDTVVQVMQKGYMLKDRVLRPAMVSVAN